MKCPVCKDSLLSMSERQGVEIDFCLQCRGVWLDRGELDKIIAKSQNDNVSESPVEKVRADQSPNHYQSYKPYKKRKSFLEELFD